jgi:glyoxylate reductase
LTKALVTREIPGELDIPDADIVIGPPEGYPDPNELRQFVASHAPIDAIVTMSQDRVDNALLDAAGDQLRVISNFAVGYDNINLAVCNARGIVVCNTPKAVTEGTADLTWALLLGASRRLRESQRMIDSGEYAQTGALGMCDLLGVDIAGRTLLIVGAGRIGYAVALRSIGWGMRVLYVARSRHYSFEFAPINATQVSLEDGLRQADFVSLHTPLTPETKHLINADRLALLKPTAVLVNTARGQVVDEQALVAALNNKSLFAAGLDVYENEPNISPELLELDNVVLTPHIGSGARRYRLLMTEIVSGNIRAVLDGDAPVNVVTA